MQALVDNWYTTAGELAALPDETARSLGLPLRLKAVVGELLAQPDVAAEGSSLGSVQAGGGSSAAVALSTPRSSSASSRGDEAEVQLSDSEADGRLAEALEAMRGSGGEADAAAAAAWDQAHMPVEQRRCPPIRRAGFSREDLPKIVKRSRPRKYALSVSWRHVCRLGTMQDVVQQCAGQVCSSRAIRGTTAPQLHARALAAVQESELTPALRAELEALHRFLTVRFFGAQQDPISDVTAKKYADHIRRVRRVCAAGALQPPAGYWHSGGTSHAGQGTRLQVCASSSRPSPQPPNPQSLPTCAPPQGHAGLAALGAGRAAGSAVAVCPAALLWA